MKKNYLLVFLCFVFLKLNTFTVTAETITVFVDQSQPQIVFASNELQTTLESLGHTVTYSTYSQIAAQTTNIGIIISSNNSAVIQQLLNEGGSNPVITKKESYSIRKTTNASKTKYWVVGNDLSGAMYGGIDLAEMIRLSGFSAIANNDYTPYIEKRGLKFNIPLDARTPSYADFGSSAQANIETVWDINFWKEFIDDLAKYHYNSISLWNEHPFPSMIKLTDYPNVALNDVKKTIFSLNTLHANYNTQGKNMVTADILNNLTTVKTISIDNKIQFWKDVMQYGKDRGVEFYFFTWNVFVYGADGKYGITGVQTNSVTTDYYKKSIKQMFVTYPLLAGIGFTAGENMTGDKETWLYNTYAQGMMEAMALFPNRNLRLIHRAHQASLSTISNTFSGYTGQFDFSFKYAYAHVYGSTNPTYADQDFIDLPSDKRAWVELRNDDIFNFRWGNSDFVREFINNIPPATKLRGFLLGSDGYVWGREFTSTEPESTRELEIKKHWYHFMLWGRLGYNPQLTNDHFKKIIENKFSPSGNLYQAWTDASKIIPTVTEFHWWDRDLEWAVEGCIRRTGWPKTSIGEFHNVNDFINTSVQPGSAINNIVDYVNKTLANTPITGATPITIASKLQTYASSALNIIDNLGETNDKSLRLTKGDISAMALLGHYYAEKILGATAYQFYLKTNLVSHQADAISHLEAASEYWFKYATIASSQYNPQILARNGHLDWLAIQKNVFDDIKIVSNSTSAIPPVLTFVTPTNMASINAPASIQVKVNAIDDVSISNVKLYLNNVLVRQESTYPYEWGPAQNDLALSNMQAGNYILKAVATDNSGITNETSISINVVTGQLPYTSIINIPGIVEAENYDKGGEDISYNDSNTGNAGGVYRADNVDIQANPTGYHVAWTVTGEWLEYRINVATAGNYNFKFTYASLNSNAVLGASFPDENTTLFTGCTMASTASWTTFATRTRYGVPLTAGNHTLRLNIESGGLNIDKIEITAPLKSDDFENSDEYNKSTLVFPNPSANGIFNLGANSKWEVYTSLGLKIYKSEGNIIDLSIQPKGIYLLKLGSLNVKLLYN